MKYNLFIGRWQTWHPGHDWLISQAKGQVWIAIRDCEKDEKNPRTALEIFEELSKRFCDRHDIYISIIPDIESVNYGRDVGYEVIQHIPPEDIKQISGTKIRLQNK